MTSALSILVLALPVFFSIVVFFMPEKVESPTLHKRLRWGFVGFGILYSFLVWFSQYRTDADNEIAKKDALEKNSVAVRGIVQQEDQKVMVQLNGAISTLSNLVSSQQKQINDIHNSNIVSGKNPIKVQVTNPTGSPAVSESSPQIHVATLPATPNPQYGKHAVRFILTTTKVMNGGRVRVECSKGKINLGSPTIPGAGGMTAGGGGVIDDHTYVSGIGSPNWSPDFPLLITLYYDSDDLGVCRFTPLN